MVKVRVRHLIGKRLKSGRTLLYWQPSAALRKHGFQPRRLSDEIATAIAEAAELNRKVDAWRRGEEPVRFQPEAIPWLICLYRSDDCFRRLKPNTKKGYDQCLSKVEAWSERAGHPPLCSIERKHVKQFYRSMSATPTYAFNTIKVLRTLLQFAVDEGHLSVNPASKPRLHAQPPRQQVWSAEDLQVFSEVAVEAGRRSVWLAVLLGASLGQRQGDILKLNWQQYANGAITLRQGKTGVLLRVPATTELQEVLDATPRQSPTIVVSEATERPYRPDHFRHEFRRIATAAHVENLQFLDLRRTAVVRLAEAGCTPPEIAAITGHQLDRTARILETYLPRTTPMAEAAIHKLELHRKRTKLEG